MFYQCSYYVSGPGNILVKKLSIRKFSDFIKNILICVPEMNGGLMGLEEHEGE